MNLGRSTLCVFLSWVLLVTCTPWVNACGPDSLHPIFVFETSPDLPLVEYVQGKVGIVRPTFGRKTLVVAYRYLNGGAFNAEEQRELIDALKGKAPEEDDVSAIKAWVDVRKLVTGDQEELPEMYKVRPGETYDFFPNCTKNAFEIATETLRDRIARFSAGDPNVRDWLQAQDTVFRNCDAASDPPAEASAERPEWLRKDRDYQIAAALFYALRLPEARQRFQAIAEDNDSVWQETAAYLVARSLIREASLSEAEKKRHELYQKAETTLLSLIGKGGKFRNAATRLLALVKYRLRPEERVHELGQLLGEQSGDENLRQDLIDYSWLLDKFDEDIRQAEERRANQKLADEPGNNDEEKKQEAIANAANQIYEAVQKGELIQIWFTQKDATGRSDYTKILNLNFKPETTEAEVLESFELQLGRKLTPEEAKEIQEKRTEQLHYREWLISPNRKLGRRNEYEGCYDNCTDNKLASLPEVLQADSLTDWIFTFQSNDPDAYAHASARWRQTHSEAWLLTALAKAQLNSPSITHLLKQAEQIPKDAPAFPTAAYHLVRLRVAANQKPEARKLLDEILGSQFELLPISAQNEFLEQRMLLAENTVEFLRFAVRRPVAFRRYGTFGRISDFLRVEKSFWHSGYEETKEEYEQKIEAQFSELLPWDDRTSFDDKTVEIFNWHFPLTVLLQASRDPALPPYLQRRLALTVWTRAILLKNEDVARNVAPDLIKLAPEMSTLLASYVNAKTAQERNDSALYTILKFPDLTPLVTEGIPSFTSAEDINYYFETSWWCKPADTQYDNEGNEVPKNVVAPTFLSPESLAAARKERSKLISLGEGKSFLGRQVWEWAKRAPEDPRVPEALFIAIKANEGYKYGCGMWEGDDELRNQLTELLKQHYSQSPWTAKLAAEEDP